MGLTTSKISPAETSNIYVSPTSAMVTQHAGIEMYRNKEVVETYLQKMEERTNMRDSYALHDEIFGPYPDFYKISTTSLKERKTIFYENVRDGIQYQDYRQVVLFADGINPMVVALATEFPEVQFYCTDIDTDILQTRQEVFEEMGLSNIHCIYHDADRPDLMKEALFENGVDVHSKTFATMEGLLMYIKNHYEIIETFLSFCGSNHVIADVGNQENYANNPCVKAFIDWGSKELYSRTQSSRQNIMVDMDRFALNRYWISSLQVSDSNFEAIYEILPPIQA